MVADPSSNMLEPDLFIQLHVRITCTYQATSDFFKLSPRGILKDYMNLEGRPTWEM